MSGVTKIITPDFIDKVNRMMRYRKYRVIQNDVEKWDDDIGYTWNCSVRDYKRFINRELGCIED